MSNEADKMSNLPTDIVWNDKSLYIWIDILGFSDELEKSTDQRNLLMLLKKFSKIFKDNSYSIVPISDGIIITVKPPFSANKLTEIFNIIQNKQKQFVMENKKVLRGGIALGRNRLEENKEEMSFITDGLAKAVKMESKNTNWPVIATSFQYLKEIKAYLKVDNKIETFGLRKGYNIRGEEIYFIDFLQAYKPLNKATQKEKNKFRIQKEEYYEFIKVAFDEETDLSVRSKYAWLLRYYYHTFDDTQSLTSFKEVVL